ncbi:MAG: ABC transporter permease [Candidatus Wallbacteria bacterium]|nr:ABC transporter permease [Candidatus Wallbacteria bacterium]
MRESAKGLLLAVDGAVTGVCRLAGDVAWLLWRAMAGAVRLDFDRARLVNELDRSIVGAVPLIVLTGMATGAVMVWQTVEGLARFGASAYAAKIVALSIVRELSPVLVGLLAAGRVGSAIAADLGSMAITEQLDAMRALALDRYRHLVTPRVLALAAGLPLLVLIFDLAGLTGGLLAGVLEGAIPWPAYVESARSALYFGDVAAGMAKGAVSGLLIALVGCAYGLTVDPRQGASAVGARTTAAVVAASVAVLAGDVVMTRFWMRGLV